MRETEKFPVLDYIVQTLQKAIADSKIEYQSPDTCMVKDGNDEILLTQIADDNDQSVTIKITDKRRIIYSEDLMEPLQDIGDDVKGNDTLRKALQSATIIINDLNIETELVFQAIKDFLDQLSNSYEFIQTVENNVTKIGAGFKFGKHIFRLNIANEPAFITLEPRFTASFDAGIQKTITADIVKVQQAVNKMFKAD